MVREAPSHAAFRDCAGSSGRTFWMLGTAHTSISAPNEQIEAADSKSANFTTRMRMKLGAFGVSSWNINLTGLASAYYSMPRVPGSDLQLRTTKGFVPCASTAKFLIKRFMTIFFLPASVVFQSGQRMPSLLQSNESRRFTGQSGPTQADFAEMLLGS
jgi:hypothetical protein